MDELNHVSGFEWDEGNLEKNWEKHHIADPEAEEIFFNIPLIVTVDKKHSQAEKRYFALGITNAQRGLFIAFTIRTNRIRIISARDMTQKEWKTYAQADT